MLNEMFGLDGQVAFITGAARGLGQFYSATLAEAGADIVVSDLKLDTLEETVKLVESFGRKALALECNVRDVDSIQAAMEKAAAHFGRIDILINNAGLNVRKRALDITQADWDTVLEINLRGQFFVAQACARVMKEQGYGRIVNVGSVTTHFAYKGMTPYCASRGGVRQMTMSLACDYAEYGISVNCLAPGWYATEQTRVLCENDEWREYIFDRIPMHRMGVFDELRAPLLFLTSKANSYYTGQVVLVDGGITTGDTRATVN